jgi:hypothetical protein
VCVRVAVVEVAAVVMVAQPINQAGPRGRQSAWFVAPCVITNLTFKQQQQYFSPPADPEWSANEVKSFPENG